MTRTKSGVAAMVSTAGCFAPVEATISISMHVSSDSSSCLCLEAWWARLWMRRPRPGARVPDNAWRVGAISSFPVSVAIGASTVLVVAAGLGWHFEAGAAKRSPFWAATFGPFTAVVSLELGRTVRIHPRAAREQQRILRVRWCGLGLRRKPLYWVISSDSFPQLSWACASAPSVEVFSPARGERERDHRSHV